MNGRGDGAARIAAPDSARLDFFLAGGFGGGAAVLDRRLAAHAGLGDLVRRSFRRRRCSGPRSAGSRCRIFPTPPFVSKATILRADIGQPGRVAAHLSRRHAVRAEHVEADG